MIKELAMDSSVYQSRTINIVFATGVRLPLDLSRRLPVRPHGSASRGKGWSRA
jgi:hypothetical protein